jgi:hypothetical protein
VQQGAGSGKTGAASPSVVEVQHKPGVWVPAQVEQQWQSGDRSRLSCYYKVGLAMYYRVFDADDYRPMEHAA